MKIRLMMRDAPRASLCQQQLELRCAASSARNIYGRERAAAFAAAARRVVREQAAKID